ncbi:class I SAM-dependent DNA methyltransferase [Legionella bononiensis]|uniref:Class I SAM-dependent methyltransferase n=1 Tax=Legionella bononiensis TaxID=2793102 RepID=A0ABS1W9X8_9GAMM|nr:class I SAM-dependent methyltransferase [Legionella bononiensis]MBL7480629.1 class I SAM-dependent methyltransferase [Legionella bononiensis]MBL7526172.1 class I SAM-dependent methyltransferase [Legionella bononiensis]MBL7563333.1 class I SAM-dependent methyltransferase [Legionella bononiensis]
MNKCTLIMPAIVYLLLITMGTSSFASQYQDNWEEYLDGSVGRNIYYLYTQVMSSSFQNKAKYRALDLGSGAGDVALNLASLGWDVTCVDTSKRAGKIINERMNFINGSFNFQLSEFENATLSGKYDFVLSFFSLPFGDKNNLPYLIKKISQHMKPDALFAVNFFGNKHTFVKNGKAYGISQDELKSILTSNGFEIRYFLHRYYKQAGGNGESVNWDIFDVIAKKSQGS